jgi:hypothetical protein
MADGNASSEFEAKDFEIGFWHPFGPHGGETPEDIIERKRAEIARNRGWTLWSFQSRTLRTFSDWYQAIVAMHPSRLFVFCARSVSAVDPDRDGSRSLSVNCARFQFVGDGRKTPNWQPMPGAIRVRHPFPPGKRLASAFVVQQIIYPVQDLDRPSAEWLDAAGVWRQDPVPTRGEYLIRRGGDDRSSSRQSGT